jgi:hypothetical protein
VSGSAYVLEQLAGGTIADIALTERHICAKATGNDALRAIAVSPLPYRNIAMKL